MINKKTSMMFRGIAILMVMASHIAGGMLGTMMQEFVTDWGVYGVDIFLVLSGYGLTKSAEKTGVNKAFVIKRFLTVYVPYLLIVGFLCIRDGAISDSRQLVTFIVGKDYWYIPVILSMYICFMGTYRLAKVKELVLTVLIIGLSVFLWKAGYASFWFVSNGAFLIGVYGARLENKLGSRFETAIRRYNGAAYALVLMIVFGSIDVFADTLWGNIVLSMLFSIMVFFLCVQVYGGGLFLPAIGRYSLYIYLLHMRIFWPTLLNHSDWGTVTSVLYAAIVTIVISVAVGYSIEWNIGRLLQRKKT